MQNDKLLPCPFCGGEVELMFTELEEFTPKVWETENDTGVLFFQCHGCDSVFTHDEPISTAKKMIEWWNTRKPMERIVEQLEVEKEKANERAMTENSIHGHTLDFESFYGQRMAYCQAIGIVKGGV